MRLAIVLLALFLAGCGGKTNSAPSPTSPPAPTRNEPPLFLYFGIAEKQLEETADHVGAILTPDWGDWATPEGREAIAQRTIAYLVEAKKRGIKKAVVCVGFLVFTADYRYKGTADLVAFKQRLAGLDIPEIIALYPVDEPDLKGIPDATMAQIFAEIEAAWAPCWVIYGDHATPGIGKAKVVGRDAYEKGAAAYEWNPGKPRMIVPGGASPWRNPAEPAYDYAMAHADVEAIMAFEWFDRADGQGIRSNGMAAAYRAIGLKCKGSA